VHIHTFDRKLKEDLLVAIKGAGSEKLSPGTPDGAQALTQKPLRSL